MSSICSQHLYLTAQVLWKENPDHSTYSKWKQLSHTSRTCCSAITWAWMKVIFWFLQALLVSQQDRIPGSYWGLGIEGGRSIQSLCNVLQRICLRKIFRSLRKPVSLWTKPLSSLAVSFLAGNKDGKESWTRWFWGARNPWYAWQPLQTISLSGDIAQDGKL